MKDTIDEKRFIIENKPNVQITGVGYDYVAARFGDGEGEGDITNEFSFVCDKAVKAEDNDREYETLLITLHCRDLGINLPQKEICFCGEAQVFDGKSGRDYSLTPPSVIFSEIADSEGNFDITVSMALDETLPGKDVLVEELVKNHARIIFTQVRFENGFVCEKIDSLCITLSPDPKEITVVQEGLSYALVQQKRTVP